MGTVAELIGRRFKERAVFFDAPGRRSATTRLRALPGVTRVAHEDGQTVLYTHGRARRTIGGAAGRGRAARRRAREPGDPAATLEDVFLDLTGRALRD